MGWLKKKTDPVSDHAQALNDEIAALEAQIKQLDGQLARGEHPRLRSTAVPHGATINHTSAICHLGGATLDNEENYLIRKLFTLGLGMVCISNQARI